MLRSTSNAETASAACLYGPSTASSVFNVCNAVYVVVAEVNEIIDRYRLGAGRDLIDFDCSVGHGLNDVPGRPG